MPDKGKGDIQEVCKVTGGKLCSCLEFCIGQPKEPARPGGSSEPPSESHPEEANQGPRVVSIDLSEVHSRLVATPGNGNPFNPWTKSVNSFRAPLPPPHPLGKPFHPLNSSVASAYGLNNNGQSRGTIGEHAQVHVPQWRIVRPDVEPVTEGEDDAEGEEIESERGRRRDKGN